MAARNGSRETTLYYVHSSLRACVCCVDERSEIDRFLGPASRGRKEAILGGGDGIRGAARAEGGAACRSGRFAEITRAVPRPLAP